MARTVTECKTPQSDGVCSNILAWDGTGTGKSERLIAYQSVQCENIGVYIGRAIVGTRASHADDTEGGGINDQIPTDNVIALLGRIITVIKTRIGSGSGSAFNISTIDGKGSGSTALGASVVSHGCIRRTGERQEFQEAGEQRRSMALIDTPYVSTAARIGNAPAGETGSSLHLSGSQSGHCASAVVFCAKTGCNNIAVPEAVANYSIIESPHQTAQVTCPANTTCGRTHATRGITVTDRTAGIGTPYQPADARNTSDVTGGITITYQACIAPHQSTCRDSPAHISRVVTVTDLPPRTRVPANQATDIVDSAHTACRISIADRARVQANQSSSVITTAHTAANHTHILDHGIRSCISE